MVTTRVPKWQIALSRAVKERMNKPFAWGTHDCCLFAAACVHAVTGKDPALDVRGTYHTAQDAAMILRDLGGLLHVAESRFGEEVPALMAQAGDVALVRFEGRDTLAICMGGHLLAPGAERLEYIPLSEALRVWRCTRAE